MSTVSSAALNTDTLLRDVVRLFNQVQRAQTACCNSATAQGCQALLVLAKNAGLTVQEFAEHMGLEKTWASRLLVRMEKDGLIHRTANPADARSLHPGLTRKGQVEQRKLAGRLEDHAVNLLNCVPATERANVTRALVHLRNALAECADNCTPDDGQC